MQHIKYFLLVCFIVFLMAGCKKNEVILADDTWYIVDDYAILMLCKTTEEESYKTLMVQLKGNGDLLKESIRTLEEMDQDAGVKNALGVAYLRLRMFQEANENFEEALPLAKSDEDKARILSNLSEVRNYQEDLESAKNYVEEALKLDLSDPLINLILQSNLAAIKLPDEVNYVKEIAEIKKLIKEEKHILGSNQFVGIFNYKTLGNACYLDDNMKRFEYYLNKALKLNHKTYQYIFVDTCLYQTLALNYSFSSSYDDLDKAFDYINKTIELLENWQVKDHYDLLNSYVIKGNLYLNYNRNTFDALKNYQHVLEQCPPYHDLAAVSYYNIAKTNEFLGDSDLAAESYAKAYYIWNREGTQDSNQEIKDAMEQIYDWQTNKDERFKGWFKKQIAKAKKDLKNQWKENESFEK